MAAAFEGPKVVSVQPAETLIEEALEKVQAAERAIAAALLVSRGDSHSLRMARALATSLADELESVLSARGAVSEVRLRARSVASA